jgi:hypothetical protein
MINDNRDGQEVSRVFRMCLLVLATGSSVQKNGLSGDSNGGYLFDLEDIYSLVEKFNSHPVC